MLKYIFFEYEMYLGKNEYNMNLKIYKQMEVTVPPSALCSLLYRKVTEAVLSLPTE